MNTETKQCPQCGETILAVAKRCKHCQSDLTMSEVTAGSAVSPKSGLDIGAVLLAVPVVGTLLTWFWIGNMNLLQSPGTSLALVVVATICITAMLAAVEASRVGATTDRKKGTYSSVQWFFIVALLWIVGYPAYLFKRRNYGFKNYLFAGLGVMVMFLGSVLLIQSSIEDRINEFKAQLGIAQSDNESLFSQFVGMFKESPDKSAGEVQATSDGGATVTELLGQSAMLKTNISEYDAINGKFPTSCAQVEGCAAAVSVSAGGRITLNLGSSGDAKLAGKSIALAPSLDAGGDIRWSCATDADFGLVPATCHHALAELPAITLPSALASARSGAPAPASVLVEGGGGAPAAEVAPATAPRSLPASQTAPATSNLRSPVAQLVVNVSGRSNPWDQAANPSMIYSATNDAFPPVVVKLENLSASEGTVIAVKCTGGTTNAGGVPDSGCDGLTQYPPTNDRFQPACSTYYPSRFAETSGYPIYTMQVLGVFANDSGVIVGKPFLVSSREQTRTVPAGATTLQLGMNDCRNFDNAATPLIVQIDRTTDGASKTLSADATQTATGNQSNPAVPTPSFDCSKASSRVETMICSTPELAKADFDLAGFYRKNIAVSGSGAAELRQGQRLFISKRDQCVSADCIAESYRARWEEIAQLGYVRQ